MESVEARLAAVARKQFGAVGRAQARAAGVDKDALRRRMSFGPANSDIDRTPKASSGTVRRSCRPTISPL
ncbi:MAG: hypothetical protein H0U92_10490 [Actinobacteria bacterium]|nr:hypothetical protein [Actinomycetota bacterium]